MCCATLLGICHCGSHAHGACLPAQRRLQGSIDRRFPVGADRAACVPAAHAQPDAQSIAVLSLDSQCEPSSSATLRDYRAAGAAGRAVIFAPAAADACAVGGAALLRALADAGVQGCGEPPWNSATAVSAAVGLVYLCIAWLPAVPRQTRSSRGFSLFGLCSLFVGPLRRRCACRRTCATCIVAFAQRSRAALSSARTAAAAHASVRQPPHLRCRRSRSAFGQPAQPHILFCAL